MSAYFGPGGNSDAFRLAGYKSTVDAPKFVKSIGLDAYEYEAGNGLSASPKILAEIGKKAAEHNIKMSFHTPYFISLSGVVEEKRLNSINYIRQSLDAAKLLGAGTIVVHSGSAAKITRDEDHDLSCRLINGWRNLSQPLRLFLFIGQSGGRNRVHIFVK